MGAVCQATCARLGQPRLPKVCGPKDEDCGACLSSGRAQRDLNEFATQSTLRLSAVETSA